MRDCFGGAGRHVLQVVMHHTVSDGWSLGVFRQELSALYTAFVAGEPSPLSPLPIQYVDYAAWQREWLQGEVLEEQIGYWRRAVGGTDAPGPTYGPTPVSGPELQGGDKPVRSPSGPDRRADGTSAARRASTLFMTLMAAFQRSSSSLLGPGGHRRGHPDGRVAIGARSRG